MAQERTIIVCERDDQLIPNSMYRMMMLSGCTYSESEYRKWVTSTFDGAPAEDAPLSELAEAAAQGGWRAFVQV